MIVDLYPWTKVEKSMLSTLGDRQSGRRTEQRQRIFHRVCSYFWESGRDLFENEKLIFEKNDTELFALFLPRFLSLGEQSLPLPWLHPEWPGRRTHCWCTASRAAGWSPPWSQLRGFQFKRGHKIKPDCLRWCRREKAGHYGSGDHQVSASSATIKTFQDFFSSLRKEVLFLLVLDVWHLPLILSTPYPLGAGPAPAPHTLPATWTKWETLVLANLTSPNCGVTG